MELVFITNRKWATKPWEDIEKPKCISLNERSQSEKTTYWIILIIWHSVKWKTMETEYHWLPVVSVGEARRGRAQRIFRTVKYYAWYNYNGYMSAYICPNPYNIKHHTDPPRRSMDVGWLWCVNVRSTIVTFTICWLRMGDCACGSMRIWKITVLPLNVPVTPNRSKKLESCKNIKQKNTFVQKRNSKPWEVLSKFC